MLKFLISFVILTSFSVNGQANKTVKNMEYFAEYYSSLSFRESPFAPHLGIHRLTALEAQKRNHYLFVYDKNNRLQSVTFKLGKTPRAPNHTSSYFWHASKEKYTYGDREIRVNYFDQFNNPISVHGEVFTSVYKLDEFGRRISLHYLNKQEKPVNNRWNIARYDWTHKEDGSIYEVRFDKNGVPQHLRPGFELFRIRLSYDVNGFVALMPYVDEQGSVISTDTGFAQDRFSFNHKGELLKYEVLDNQGQPIAANRQGTAGGNQTYTPYSYEWRASYFDTEGQSAFNSHGWWQSERRYDHYGNLVHNQFLDDRGEPFVNPITGYSSLKISWHKDGLRRRIVEYFDANGLPANHKTRGYQTVKYKYDDLERISIMYLLDKEGRLTQHGQQGWAARQYTYDSDQVEGDVGELSVHQAQERLGGRFP